MMLEYICKKKLIIEGTPRGNEVRIELRNIATEIMGDGDTGTPTQRTENL